MEQLHRPRVSDTVSYTLFGCPPEAELIGHANDIVGKDYIWQRDSFNVKVNDDGVGTGSVEFGDCVQDEWMVVYILRELSQRFPSLVIRVEDDDEQFILIEAANALPPWANPDVCRNRVFLANRRVHLIPPTISVGSLADGVRAVMSSPEDTVASDAVNAIISSRLQAFPDAAISSCQHYAICYLHARLCALLDSDPWLIAPIVEAFYHRDPIDLRVLRKMPSQSPSDYQWHSTRFTYCTFAQMDAQKFALPKAFADLFSSDVPAQQAAFDLGVKVMCGFEILLHTQQDIIKKGCVQALTDSRGRTLPEIWEDTAACKPPTPSPEFSRLRQDDASQWMTISEAEVDQMARSYAPDATADDIVRSMRSFLSRSSDLEGVQLESEPVSFDFSNFRSVFEEFDDENDSFYGSDLETGSDDLDEELPIDRPVDIDANLLENLLASYKAQAGLAGPVSNLMQSLGVHLPDDDDIRNERQSG
ncbi:SGT1 protein [Plasmodiophora brassicae]|uniref:Uncharacterized protein n=1 Tax=Plasmodiophora brassicae TaxID=37360 RepID=A0A0G4IJ60_PLABS|nr:hypothetical protein PBRA_004004 [Plasmodiophora brassicae]